MSIYIIVYHEKECEGMKRLVFFPSESIAAYLDVGMSYGYLEGYYNPGRYFDEVFCLSPWGDKEEEKIGGITYIRANPCKFGKIIRKIHPDVVRGYGGYHCADWVSISKVEGIPTIVSVHDPNPLMIYESLQYADYIVCMTECVKEAVLNKINFDSNKVWVLPNRIDAELFSKRNEHQYYDKLSKQFGGGRHILHVGRKSEEKNLETVIQALQYMEGDVSCIFAGRGDCTKYIDLAKQCGVEERCHFIESIKNNELPFWYSWSDCFCTPSKWEGFGIVFIEAAGCEAAIVTSNIAPMNEYFTNGVNALLVDEYENPRAIADAIGMVLNGGESINKMRAEARKVGLKFEKHNIDQREIEIYKKAINMGAENRKNKSLKLKADIWLKYR